MDLISWYGLKSPYKQNTTNLTMQSMVIFNMGTNNAPSKHAEWGNMRHAVVHTLKTKTPLCLNPSIKPHGVRTRNSGSFFWGNVCCVLRIKTTTRTTIAMTARSPINTPGELIKNFLSLSLLWHKLCLGDSYKGSRSAWSTLTGVRMWNRVNIVNAAHLQAVITTVKIHVTVHWIISVRIRWKWAKT